MIRYWLISGLILLMLYLPANIMAQDYCQEAAPLTDQLIHGLKIPEQGVYSISTRSRDDRYQLNITELWSLVAECIQYKQNKNFEINVIDGALGQMAMNFYIEASQAGHNDLELGLADLDSLIIGAVIMLERDPFSIHAKLRVTNLKAQNLFTSKYFDLSKLKMHPGLKIELFNKLKHARDIDRVLYNQRIIEAINNNLFTQNSVFATSRNQFQFLRKWSHGNPDQIIAIQNILQKVYGFTFITTGTNTIVLTADGSLIFTKDKFEIAVPNLVTVREMIEEEEMDWEENAFLAETVPATISDNRVIKPAVYEKIHFSSVNSNTKIQKLPVISPELTIGQKIKTAIEVDLAQSYSSNNGKPDFNYLGKVFKGEKKSILRGSVKNDPKTGKEAVRYYWDTPKEYLDGLKKKASKLDYNFDVKLKVIKVYRDNQDNSGSDRYWGVIAQDWITRNYKQDMVYKDDGFLFVNFDFNSNGQMNDLQIFYRLWFYNYKNDDKETGRKRWQLIENDITGAFDKLAHSTVIFGHKSGKKFIRDNSERGITGLDKGLVDRMKDDLIESIKKSNQYQ